MNATQSNTDNWFTTEMDTVWNMLNQLTKLADSLEQTKVVTTAHAQLAEDLAQELANAVEALKEFSDMSVVAVPA